MNNKRLILFASAVLQVIAINAQPKFYNSKSMMVGLSSNDILYSYDGGKFFNNQLPNGSLCCLLEGDVIKCKETEQELEYRGVGKKVLDLLFDRNSGALSENLLRQRAWANVQSTDVERAQYSVYSPEIILEEDILPILENNYLLITHDVYKTDGYGKRVLRAKAWVVFHVDINQRVWDAVIDNWTDLNGYDNIKVGISYVASGKCRPEHLLKEISRKVPPLAIRGQIVSKTPYKASIENAEVPSGERMLVYTQKQSGRKVVSKRIGVAKTRPQGDMYLISGVKGDPRKGDMAVLSPTSHIAHSIMFQSQSYSKSLRYTLEDRISDYGSSYASIGLDFRVGFLKDHNTALYPVGGDMNELLRSPFYASAGLVNSYGWSFIKGVNLEAYLQIQGEWWMSYYYNKNEEWYGAVIRLPIGVRASMNLLYPFHLVGGVEWGGLMLAGDQMLISDVMGARGWSSFNELSLMVGLQFAF